MKNLTYHPAVLAFRWTGTSLLVLEQKRLPRREEFIPCRTYEQVARSIRDMSVRGAPAIGCAAAYGVALAARQKNFKTVPEWVSYLRKVKKVLAATRPTAVNLFWALNRMEACWTTALLERGEGKNLGAALSRRLAAEADGIFREDFEGNLRMGRYGAALLKKGSVILTHCNAGSLATAGHGTALGVIRTAHRLGKVKKVFVDETRPYLQGARLTAWECHREGIPYELITDNMAGHFMKTERIDAVIVGADRIAANGDTANKIGTYSLSVLARFHGIPFYVAAPRSTVDLSIPDGSHIPIEERSRDEVVRVGNTCIAPPRVVARHPAFDVTPSRHIAAIVTDVGVVRSPYGAGLRRIKGV